MNLFGSAVVLAGGKSSRMGFDKALIKIQDKSMVEMVLGQLEGIFDDLIVVTNTPENYEHLNARIVTDILKGAGPLGGIHAGLKTAESRYVFLTACDMPFISIEYINYMKKIARTYLPDAVISEKGKWVEPFHSFYSRDIIPDIEINIKNNLYKIYDTLKQKCLVKVSEEKVREYSPDLRIFLNINNREDLKAFYSIRDRSD